MMQSLLHALSVTVERYPENPAVKSGKELISYRELWQLIFRVTAYLKQQNLKPGEKVALIADNSIEYITIYYGILAAGGVVVSLNGTAKDRSLLVWLQHSGSVCMLVQDKYATPKLLEKAGSAMHSVVLGNRLHQALNRETGTWQDILDIPAIQPSLEEISQQSLAAIIYTSGTTGSPKGVMLSHRNLIRNTESIISYLHLGPDDSIVNILPFYYSYGNSVLHTHLLSGACLILENSLMYPHLIVEKMQNEKVTGFSGVPSTYSLLLNRVELEKYDLHGLRYMTQAGGPMAPSEIQRVRKLLPDIRFYVMYGQTEATARLSYLPPDMLDRKPGSIGIPIPGVSIEVRNKLGRPVQVDETGEIYASGENIMMGYWQDQGMTDSVLSDGWLKTGDLAKCDQDGYLYIIGRSSDMIKSGSHRISPKEIEEVLLELDEVREVAVLGVKDDILGEVIKACVVLNNHVSPDEKRIKSHCHRNLPAFKMPKYVEYVEELPKTASGKVKRYLLQ